MPEPGPEDAAQPGPDKRRTAGARALRAGRVLFAVVVVGFFVRVLVTNTAKLRQVHLRLHPGWFVVAVPCTFLGYLLMPLAWRRLLAAYGAVLTKVEAIRVWCVAQVSRYIPSGVFAIASRAMLASQRGVPAVVGASTTVVEVAVVIGWGALISGALLPSYVVPLPVRALLVAGAAAGLLALPLLADRLPRYLPRLIPGSLHSVSPGDLYAAEGGYGLNALSKSLGVVFLGACLLPVRPHDGFLLAGAINAAAIVGMIGVTPAGLGVREGILAAILEHRFGLGNAAALAIVVRLWDLAFESSWLVAVGVIGRRRRVVAPVTAGRG